MKLVNGKFGNIAERKGANNLSFFIAFKQIKNFNSVVMFILLYKYK